MNGGVLLLNKLFLKQSGTQKGLKVLEQKNKRSGFEEQSVFKIKNNISQLQSLLKKDVDQDGDMQAKNNSCELGIKLNISRMKQLSTLKTKLRQQKQKLSQFQNTQIDIMNKISGGLKEINVYFKQITQNKMYLEPKYQDLFLGAIKDTKSQLKSLLFRRTFIQAENSEFSLNNTLDEYLDQLIICGEEKKAEELNHLIGLLNSKQWQEPQVLDKKTISQLTNATEKIEADPFKKRIPAQNVHQNLNQPESFNPQYYWVYNPFFYQPELPPYMLPIPEPQIYAPMPAQPYNFVNNINPNLICMSQYMMEQEQAKELQQKEFAEKIIKVEE